MGAACQWSETEAQREIFVAARGERGVVLGPMIIADLAKLPGGTFPARRWGRGLVGQLGQPIAAKGFSMGYSILEPKGGQVPWHNQEQEEVYFIVQGEGEICVGT